MNGALARRTKAVTIHMAQADVAFGFFDSDIPALLERCPWFVNGCSCLLTCLDSGAETAQSKLLKDLTFESVGDFALIPGDMLVAKSRELFFGFDEIYVFNSRSLQMLNVGAWKGHYTSDRVELRSAIPNELLGTFKDWDAVRYASDGLGLNVITKNLHEVDAVASALDCCKLKASRTDGFGTCAECRRTFPYYLIHNGFNDSAYAYCDMCGRTALLDLYTVPEGVALQPFTRIDKKVEPHLKQCSCGGRFTADAQPRCPACRRVLSAADAAAWIEINSAGTKKGWRWQRNWDGLYCIVIDGKSVHNPWR